MCTACDSYPILRCNEWSNFSQRFSVKYHETQAVRMTERRGEYNRHISAA